MRVAFITDLVGVFAIRSLFAGGLQRGERKGRKWREAPVYLVGAVPFIGGFIYAVLVYLFSTDPSWMYLGLPDLARWVGLLAALAASAFLLWVFKTVGTAGAKTILTFDDMKLATKGPYSTVRHPMYSGLFLWSLTWLLLTDNWVVGATFACFIVFIAIFRVPHEEKVLMEHFGDEYRRYMARTSRFLPLGSGKSSDK